MKLSGVKLTVSKSGAGGAVIILQLRSDEDRRLAEAVVNLLYAGGAKSATLVGNKLEIAFYGQEATKSS